VVTPQRPLVELRWLVQPPGPSQCAPWGSAPRDMCSRAAERCSALRRPPRRTRTSLVPASERGRARTTKHELTWAAMVGGPALTNSLFDGLPKPGRSSSSRRLRVLEPECWGLDLRAHLLRLSAGETGGRRITASATKRGGPPRRCRRKPALGPEARRYPRGPSDDSEARTGSIREAIGGTVIVATGRRIPAVQPWFRRRCTARISVRAGLAVGRRPTAAEESRD